MSWEDTIEDDFPVNGSWEDTIEDDAQGTREVSKLESAGRGAAQGASLGFADEIVGGAKALWDVATTDAELLDMRASYPEYRDEYRQADKAAQQANPITYGAGNVAGGAATMLIPGLNVAKGATALNAARTGALVGGAVGLGGSEAEDAQGLAEDALKGAALGGVTGGAAQGALNKMSSATKRTADILQDLANTQSGRAMGATKGTINKLGIDKVKQIGNEGLTKGIVTPLAKTDTMIQRANSLQASGGRRMGAAFEAIDNQGLSTFNPLNVAAKVDEEIGGFARSPINKDITSQFENTLESIVMRGADDISLKDAQTLKQEIARVAFPNGKPTNPDMITDKQRMAMDAYRIVNKAIDDAADQASYALDDPSIAKKLLEGKADYATGKNANKLLSQRQSSEAGNKMFGLTDNILGAGGLATTAVAGVPGAVVSAGAFGLKKLGEKYGAQTVAYGAHKLADVIRKDPFAFGKFSNVLSQAAARGGSSLAATHYLLQQQDPEYRELSQKALNNEEAP